MTGPGLARGIRIAVTLVSLLLVEDGGFIPSSASATVLSSHDELVWTKTNWLDYKLGFPGEAFAYMHRTNVKTYRSNSCELSSIDGPPSWMYKEGSAGREGNDGGEDQFQRSVEHAASAATCLVCHSVVSALWQAAVTRASKQAPVDAAWLSSELPQVCTEQGMQEFLAHNALVRLQTGQGESTTIIYALREREPGEQQGEVEGPAVLQACRKVVQELRAEIIDAVGGEGAVLSAMVSRTQTQAAGAGKGQEAAEADAEEDAAVGCADHHKSCSFWASIGECKRNPLYMVGDGQLPGHCMRACGMCMPPTGTQPAEALGLSRKLVSASLTTLSRLQSSLCGSSFACLEGVMGSARHQPAGSSSGAAAAAAADEAVKPQQVHSGSRVSVLQKLRTGVLVRYVLEEPAEVASDMELVEVSKDIRSADRLLNAALKGSCIALSKGWWIYELCWKQHVKQLHLENRPQARAAAIASEHLLGDFNREASERANQGSGPAGSVLLHASEDGQDASRMKLPYLEYRYSGGGLCEKTEALVVTREVRLKVMCSPDTEMHMSVQEPDTCSYLLIVMLPQLCQHFMFKVQSTA